ncbi:MAG: hypothetical protein AB8B71_12890 [Paracoccaceae bacterium]
MTSGCASRFNPLNWFGRSEAVAPADPVAEVNPLIPTGGGLLSRNRGPAPDLTTPIDTVSDIKVERVPGGAIIRAVGVDATQGAFNVELVPMTEDEQPVDGVLSYTLERQKPDFRTRQGPVVTREVAVARHVTDQTLSGVRTIRIVADQNARQVRR